MHQARRKNVVVVGGGLAGLATATYLGRAGHAVTLLEKSRALGGRAITQIKDGVHFNLGPHALYRQGEGVNALRDLGVAFTGGVPSVSGAYAICGGRKHTLPGGFVSLLTTGLLGLSGKLDLARLLGTIQKIDVTAILEMTVRDWLDSSIHAPDARRLVQALLRLSTYTHAPELQSAGAAVAQLQLALAGNVLYIDGGWQTLVDGLRLAATRAGVEIEAGTRAVAVERDRGGWAVRLADGNSHAASAVVLAVGPNDAAALMPSESLTQCAAAAVPVRVACLDVALARLPKPAARFALGIDRPLYFSVHSAVAKLAPAERAVIHAGKYLGPEEVAGTADEQELETLLDTVQPGWREAIVQRRYLPNMTATHALVTAATRGSAGRFGPAVPDADNLYVVGDWAGTEGMLADASLASARRAAQLILQHEALRPAAAA